MKRKMKISVIALSLLSCFAMTACAKPYKSVTVFGDSLSDSGNVGRFTVDGDTSKLYDDIIANDFGLKLSPSSKGGNNFAQGNADAVPELNPEANTQDQVNAYLTSKHGKADKHGLYIHWIGSNDVANAPQNPNTVTQTIAKSAQASVDQVKQLLDAGAKNVIVPNVPHLGYTPFVLETVAGQFGTQGIATAYQALDGVKTPDLKSRNDAAQLAFKKVAEQQTQDPTQQAAIAKQLFDAWQQLSVQVNQLADAYNAQEDAGLKKLHGKIIRPDIAGLFDKIIADPGKYNLTNTLGTACPTGIPANECHSNQPGFNDNQHYLFADRFHPTPAVHAIIGKYIESVIHKPFKGDKSAG